MYRPEDPGGRGAHGEGAAAHGAGPGSEHRLYPGVLFRPGHRAGLPAARRGRRAAEAGGDIPGRLPVPGVHGAVYPAVRLRRGPNAAAAGGLPGVAGEGAAGEASVLRQLPHRWRRRGDGVLPDEGRVRGLLGEEQGRRPGPAQRG